MRPAEPRSLNHVPDLFRLYLLPYAKFIPAVEETWGVSSVGATMSRIAEQATAGTVAIGVVTSRDLSAALAD
jgi:hypothetical protein